MLQQMRGIAKSWISSIFLLGLALSFGIWGVGDILRGSAPDSSVASVGDVQITPDEFQRDLRNYLAQLSRDQGHQVTNEEARAQGLDRKILDSAIDNAALDQAVSHLGLVATKAQIWAEIQAIPAFRGPLGTFDNNRMEEVLQENGLVEQTFLGQLRGDIAREQLVQAAGAPVELPPPYAKLYFDFLNQRRAAKYIQLTAADLPPLPAATDVQLLAYMRAHTLEFSTPEYHDVTFLSLGPEDLSSQVKVSDAQLKQIYEEDKDKYQIPEKRDVEQIMFPTQAAAQAARAKIAAGESFGDAARAAGKSPSDISLGSVQQADLTDRGQATFALAQGEVTQPVKSTFGWALLHVTKITPAVNKTFDQVKPDIYKQAFDQLAAAKLSEVINAFEDARAGGAAFTEAAQKVGMRVVHLAAVDIRTGLAPNGAKTDLPDAPEFRQQLAKAEVGDEGDPFQTQSGHVYAIKVSGVTPPKLKSLDEVRAQVTARWTADQSRTALANLAKSLAAKAEHAGNLDTIAAQLHATVQSTPALSRQSTEPGAALVKSIFDAPPNTAVTAPGPSGETYDLAWVTGVATPPLPAGNPLFARFSSEVGGNVGQDLASALAGNWRDRLGVKINQANVDRATGGS